MDSFIALLTGLVILATAVVGFLVKLNSDAQELSKNVQEIHVMVNDRMTEALKRIDQLDETIKAAGIESPDRPERH